MDSGTMNSHHAPRDIRRNFETTSIGSPECENKKAPGYILDYGQPSKLERKWSKEKEDEDEKRRKKLKKFLVYFLTILAVLITIAVIVIVLLYFLTCIFGNCPEGCYDCKYAEKSDWKREGNSYSGKKRHCGNTLKLHVTDNSFTLDSSVKGSGGTKDMDTTAPLIHSFSSMVDGKEKTTMELYWYMEQTVRNNDSLKLVFSDNGDRYAGLGDLGKAVFRPKGEEAHYTLWVNDDNPIYLPFYLSRNKESSLCMFADAGGAPMEVSVKGSRTEWLIYKQDKVYFHIYSESTSLKAMTKCTEKWRELYPSPDASWTDDFIIGSLSTDEIKAARAKAGILGTHYILAPGSISINDGDLKIENENEISNYDKVFLPWTAKQNLKDSGYDLKSENGYFKTDEEDVYFLDYDNTMVKSDISSAINPQTMAGVILQNDFYHNINPSDTCRQYNYCSTNSVFFDWDSDLCMGDRFGEKALFQRHNYYDISRSEVVRSTGAMVVESVAAPGTTHFHRGNIELTPEGLSTCFHNILNLQLIGIRAVSCNMCGGLIPQETDIEQTRVCNRLSQLAFIMPYVIMTNDEEPPLITDEKDAGRYVKNNLNARKQFKYYLESAYKDALQDNTPFVYTIGTAYNDDLYNDNQQGVIIGERLLYVVVLENAEDGKDLKISFPPGYWSSNGGPLTGEYFAGGQDRVQSLTDMSNLIYFKVPGIFVLADSDNPNHAVVRVYLPFLGPYDQITHTFNYYLPVTELKHSTQITFNPEDGANSASIKFSYDGEAPNQDINISRIEVYRWFANNDSPPDWVAFNARGNNKFNVVFDYMQRKASVGTDAQSLFKTWTQNFEL